ncbi:hypothetical protein chiPu_0004804 [Chiloscyllium punctatum]|uniref:Uncharacterized protein n=1 Tax=Chiloscyllium punctatum TaxID=137246 RepID=A0A401S7K8_CHIPU|nr:hypothetical protein [Chiloscyllium punctatum]
MRLCVKRSLWQEPKTMPSVMPKFKYDNSLRAFGRFHPEQHVAEKQKGAKDRSLGGSRCNTEEAIIWLWNGQEQNELEGGTAVLGLQRLLNCDKACRPFEEDEECRLCMVIERGIHMFQFQQEPPEAWLEKEADQPNEAEQAAKQSPQAAARAAYQMVTYFLPKLAGTLDIC